MVFPMSETPMIVIIGAGPAGLGAAWRLWELGIRDFVVLERNAYVGGLAASFTDANGFTWDIGGHVTHSHYPYFDRVFSEVMDGNYFTHSRQSWVYMNRRFIPYPFQNNIHRLPLADRQECLRGLIEAKSGNDAANFADWLLRTYGEGIAKRFMIPYNRKTWAYPLTDMSYQWIADRVAPVDIGRIMENIRNGTDDSGWGPNAVFHYPKRGNGDLWRRVSEKFSSRIRLKTAVTGIDAATRRISLSDGERIPFTHVFSSMPLPTLTDMVAGVNLPVLRSRLHASAIMITGLGMRGEPPDGLNDKSWIYFPEADVPFFRATVLSNYSKELVPAGTWSLMLETSFSETVPLPKGDLTNAIIRMVRKFGFIPENAPTIDRWTMMSRYGYPTPTLDRDSIVDPVIAVLEANGIASRGRFGLWKYEVSNQDHTFMQGVEWADTLHTGSSTVQ